MLIAIEGIDGSGKGTQAQLLANRLEDFGEDVDLIQFPRYTETVFGREIGHYLNGEFGDLMSVHPKLGALLYAGDRFETRERLIELLNRDRVVICDRYTPSNQAHHAAKLPSREWDQFFDWVELLEYGVFSIPRPDLVVFLDVDATLSAQLIKKKPKRAYTERAADIHEINEAYQAKVREAYHHLVARHNWVRVECMSGPSMKCETEVASIVWQHVEPLFGTYRNVNASD